MVKAKKRIRVRSFGRQSRQLAKMAKKIDGLAASIETDEQRRSKELESTITVLKRQLEEDQKERASLTRKGCKSFTMKHTFAGVLNKMKEEERVYGEEEEHFGVKWTLCIEREKNDYLGIFLEFQNPYIKESGWMELEEEILLSVNDEIVKMEKTVPCLYGERDRDIGLNQFMTWKHLRGSMRSRSKVPYEGEFTISYRVIILKTSGVAKYTAPIANLTDVVLDVNGTKFYVSKQCLANHCDFFHHLFYENFAEKGKKMVTLKGVDPRDFQDFLDVVYGEQVIEEENVEGILVIADMYRAVKTIAHCEQFLIYKSCESSPTKFALACKYKMNALALHCISEIEDMSDFRHVVQDYFPINDDEYRLEELDGFSADHVDKTVYRALVEKAIELKK